MNALSKKLDAFAIGLSVACTLHCFLLPVALTLLPALMSTGIQDERFHFFLIFAVIPTSTIALLMGCRKHRKWPLLALGGSGLLLLFFAESLGHDIQGGEFEKWFTLAGSSLIALSHVWNYRLCRKEEQCPC